MLHFTASALLVDFRTLRCRSCGADFETGEVLPEDPQEWLAHSKATPGSWWDLWVKWISQRSGTQRAAPTTPGSAKYPPIGAAPGEYVRA